MILRTTVLIRWLCLTLVALVVAATAQTNQPPSLPDRYLLILDVSAPMSPRAAAVQSAVSGMLISGMQGQLKDGDQLGIWTFNDQLHSGDFELLVWKDSERNDQIRRVMEFVKSLSYKNRTRFDRVRPVLEEVMRESRRITVILVSDGDEVIQGTPFDLAIGRYFQENAAELKERKVPIITVMRGYKGQWIGHKISYAPWPMDFPSFPAEPDPIPESRTENKPSPTSGGDLSRTLVTTNRGPIVFAEPLIVSGKSRVPAETVPVQANTNLNAVSTATAELPPGNPPASGSPSSDPHPGQSPEKPAPLVPVSGAGANANLAPAGSAGTDSDGNAGESSWSPLKWFSMGLLGVAAVGGVLILARKPRSKGRGSLITRSMDTEEPKR